MVTIVPRNTWCTTPPRGTPSRIATPSRDLWLHHGAAGTSTIATANAYARHHIVNNGWADIGYSYLIAEGRVLEGRGAGRQGAHTAGHNTRSHGICIVGSYSSRAPAQRDLDALVALVRHGAQRGWWAPRLSGGHRDAAGSGTSCPGAALHRLIPALNRTIQEDDMAALSEEAQAFYEAQYRAAKKNDVDPTSYAWLLVGYRALKGALGKVAPGLFPRPKL